MKNETKPPTVVCHSSWRLWTGKWHSGKARRNHPEQHPQLGLGIERQEVVVGVQVGRERQVPNDPPGPADMVDMTVGDRQVVLIFDEAMKL